MKTAGIVGAVLMLLPVLFLIVSGLVMFLINVVLTHYGVTTIDYTASMAVLLLSVIFFGGSKVGSNNK